MVRGGQGVSFQGRGGTLNAERSTLNVGRGTSGTANQGGGPADQKLVLRSELQPLMVGGSIGIEIAIGIAIDAYDGDNDPDSGSDVPS